MTEQTNPISRYGGGMAQPPTSYGGNGLSRDAGGSSLADVLERVLDKGLVIAGDVRINLLDIELLTIKLRLLIASADKAREMGIDWWAHDPNLSSKAAGKENGKHQVDGDGGEQQKKLMDRMDRLESQISKLLEQTAPPATSKPRSKSRAPRGENSHGSGQR